MSRESGRAAAETREGAMTAALEETFEALEPNDRALVEGKYLEGRTVRELAAQTGLTEKAVESAAAAFAAVLYARPY